MYDKLPDFTSRRSFHWLIFVVAGCALYGFTLHYPFVFDDRIFVRGNPLISNPDAYLDLLDLDEYIGNYLQPYTRSDVVTSFVLRPVAYLTFSFNYLIGGNDPSGYRMFNIGVHIANAVMLYQALFTIIRRRVGGGLTAGGISVPFFAALIFLVHPLQTQSVTYITQRFASLGTFFYLATLLLYIRSSAEGSVGRRRLAYEFSLLTLLLGLLTRESLFTLPIALVMVDVLLLRMPLRNTLVRLAPHIACMALIPLRVLDLASELRDAHHTLASSTSFVSGVYSRSEYAITQLRAILSYLRLLLLPYSQNFDPNYPLYRSLLNTEIIISLLVWILFIAAGVSLLRRRERTVYSDLAGFSIFWFPLSISVSSSFIPLTDLMLEHRTYLPSLAFCTGSVAYIQHLVADGNIRRKNLMIAGLCLVSLIYAGVTIRRNQVYSSRIALWNDTVRKSPYKYRPRYALATSYVEKKAYDKAIRSFKRALSIEPGSMETNLALGALYLQLNRPDAARELYEKYLDSYQAEPRILTNLAYTYMKLGMYRESMDTMNIILPVAENSVRMLGLLAELNLHVGNLQDARSYLEKAREADRNDTRIDMTNELNTLEKQIGGVAGGH